ncbi:uncharacterized protein LOC119650005 isoform X2 [Hermetia illucens]|uniref:uncharacterized protein LOC119650005 isoform X2 n=1 Tax=Hermetia illucens TaxID=343691 RepID=UPI0018CC6180|nr:uncharacterized protein LOC119650005 isoform X2 [Hermetia illucens]
MKFLLNMFGIKSTIFSGIKRYSGIKASDLLGLKPDIVLQIASNAINFWTHQCSLQMKMMRHKLDQYRSTLITTKSELEKNKESYDNMIRKIHTKLYDANKRIRQLSLEVSEKDRQIIKFQRTRCGFCS